MKKGIAILIAVCICFTSAFAQTAPKIQRAYAFYTESIPGMAMADEKGNTINPRPVIERFIYVECSGTKVPDIHYVSFDNVEYNPTLTLVAQAVVRIGKKEENGNEIMLSAKKGNNFWKLNLQLTPDGPKNPPINAKRIVLYGRYGKHPYQFRLYNETKLITPDRY